MMFVNTLRKLGQRSDKEGEIMGPLDLVKLTPLMERTPGKPEITIGLIDGPVLLSHADLSTGSIREVPRGHAGTCSRTSSAACTHGTFVAGILSAKRGSLAPAICPRCTLLTRPIFSETADANGNMPSATPDALAKAIVDAVNAGANVLNLSAALAQPSTRGEKQLEHALDYAAARGAIAVVAAGNQGTVGGSALTRHAWVIPVAGCDRQGRPVQQSNLGRSIGRRGLSAPAENITSLGTDGTPVTIGGTSAAVPFVTGAVALLWSEFPGASASQVKFAITQGHVPRRPAIVPPLLNAWAAYQFMLRRRYAT
jgi:subtilisin family serine protease